MKFKKFILTVISAVFGAISSPFLAAGAREKKAPPKTK